MITMTLDSMQANGHRICKVEMILTNFETYGLGINFFLHLMQGNVVATSTTLNQAQTAWLDRHIRLINDNLTLGKNVNISEVFKGWQPVFRKEWRLVK